MVNFGFSSRAQTEFYIDTVDRDTFKDEYRRHSTPHESLSISFDTTQVSKEGQDYVWNLIIYVWEKTYHYPFVRLNLIGSNLDLYKFIPFIRCARRKNLDHKIFVNFIDVNFKDLEIITGNSFIKNISFDCANLQSAFLQLMQVTRSMKCPLKVLELRNVSIEDLKYILQTHNCKFEKLEATVRGTVTPTTWEKISVKCLELREYNPNVSFLITESVPADPKSPNIIEILKMKFDEKHDFYFSIQSNLNKAREEQIETIKDKFTDYNVVTSSSFRSGGNRAAIHNSTKFVCFITKEYLEEASDKKSVVWRDLSYALKRGSQFFTVVILDEEFARNQKLWIGHDIVFELGPFLYLNFTSTGTHQGRDLGPDPDEIGRLKAKVNNQILVTH